MTVIFELQEYSPAMEVLRGRRNQTGSFESAPQPARRSISEYLRIVTPFSKVASLLRLQGSTNIGSRGITQSRVLGHYDRLPRRPLRILGGLPRSANSAGNRKAHKVFLFIISKVCCGSFSDLAEPPSSKRC
jgi:hypothetical protein